MLLLLLGCGNFLLGTPTTGASLGGMLLMAGVWSVAGTFWIHRSYRRFLVERAEKEGTGGSAK